MGSPKIHLGRRNKTIFGLFGAIALVLTYLPGAHAVGNFWVASATVQNWLDVASSNDGTHLVAVGGGTQIYVSTDFGVTWTAQATSQEWRAVASSSDGTKLIAGADHGGLYISADSGMTWHVAGNSPTATWQAVASSSDGTHLVAAVYNGQLFTSVDSGVTWTPRDTTRNWRGLASSSDGTHLVALVWGGGQIYTSTDSGVTWTPRAANQNWVTVASSSDGTHLVATVLGGQIYTSTDSGVTWIPRDATRDWYGVASSSDGTRLVATVASGGQIYTSTDSGVTWTPNESVRDWRGVTSSSDGSHLAASVHGGQIYLSSLINTTASGSAMSSYLHWNCGGQRKCIANMGAKVGVKTNFASSSQCDSLLNSWVSNHNIQKFDGSAGAWCDNINSANELKPMASIPLHFDGYKPVSVNVGATVVIKYCHPEPETGAACGGPSVPIASQENPTGGSHNGPYVFSISTGSLPPGLSLAVNGTISGTVDGSTRVGPWQVSLCISETALSTSGSICRQIEVDVNSKPQVVAKPPFPPTATGSTSGPYFHWSCGNLIQCQRTMGGIAGVFPEGTTAKCEANLNYWGVKGYMQKFDGNLGTWCDSKSVIESRPSN